MADYERRYPYNDGTTVTDDPDLSILRGEVRGLECLNCKKVMTGYGDWEAVRLTNGKILVWHKIKWFGHEALHCYQRKGKYYSFKRKSKKVVHKS